MRTFSHHEDRSYANFKRIEEEVCLSIRELCNYGSIIEFEEEMSGESGDLTRHIIQFE